MGLLKHLLFWPYTGPRFLVDFSLEQIDGVVREELTDDTAVKAELLELQLRLELGEIDDTAYTAEEAALMQRLRDIRSWREHLGMGVSGGLVRVQQQPAAEPESDPQATATGADEAADKAPRVADPKGGADVELNLDWE